jgi:hypothetical protein
MKALFIGLLTIITTPAMTCEHGFFPDNETYIPSEAENAMGMQAQSAVVIEKLHKLYDPVFAKENKKLKVEILWDESKVNAYATRDDHNNPVLRVTGGMANHELLTTDGLALILCHEIGHFLGGEPKKLRGRSTKRSWSSAEGQADYYANAFCLKKLFRVLPEMERGLDKNHDKSIADSKSRYMMEADQICNTPLCQRIAMASFNVAEVYASTKFFGRELSLLYPDMTTVYQTTYSHPNPQCRLDTMVAALRCHNSEQLSFKLKDPKSGACDDPDFRRPRCWYYPDLNNL